jgi:hypothetical protein
MHFKHIFVLSYAFYLHLLCLMLMWLFFLFVFVLMVVLEFELRALHLLDRHSTTLATLLKCVVFSS